MSPGQAVVVGAGVVGLSAAVRLAQAGWRVQVVAAQRTPRTTSDAAAAIYFPYLCEPRGRILGWAAASLAEFRRLAKDPATGVRWAPARIVEPVHDPWWSGLVDGYRPLGPVAQGHAYACEVPVVAMPAYLAWLEARAAGLGVAFRAARLASLRGAGPADVVVNCSGLGARELVPDPSMRAVRGQVVRVHAPAVRTALLAETDPPTYAIPRPDGVVVGGTADVGAEGLEPDPAAEAAMLARAVREEPALAGARVLSRAVGLRPGRPAVRLELDRSGPVPVVHDYGHGGAGVTLSWGCADEAARLAAALR